MKSFLKVVFFVVALVVALRACGPFHSGGQLVGRPAPDFTLASVHGPYVNMTEFRGGEPALIFFWATWCPHCRTQLKELTQQRAHLEMKGIKILLVDVNEDLKTVQNFIEMNTVPFNVLLDTNGAVAGDYYLTGVPVFYFVDREGTVVRATHALPENYADLLLAL